VFAFRRRKAAIVSSIITAIVVCLTSAAALLFLRNDEGQIVTSNLLGITAQDAKIEKPSSSSVAQELQGEKEAVLVNGDLITKGSLKVSSGGFTTILQAQGLDNNQTYILPNASGTICLDSNNCGFASQAEVDQLSNQLGQIVIPTIELGVTALNGQRGAISIQGTSNQISVSVAGGKVTLATPQDIAPLSSPTFAGLLLTGSFTVNGSINTSLNCSGNLNGGVLTTTPTGQLICDDDDAGAGGGVTTAGGTAGVLPVFTGAQTIADSIISQALGTATIGGNLSVTGNLSLSSALSVANGGTGAATFTTNGVLLGNGASAITATSAPSAGQVLLGNAGGVPVFVSVTGDIGLSATGVATIQSDSVALGTDTTGNYVSSLTAGNGIAVGVAGEGVAVSVGLTALTANWNQTGAFDLVLNNANSELRVLESAGGTFYGTFDVGDLTADRTYTFPDADGTVCLTSGNCAGVGGGVTTAGGTNNRLSKFNGSQTITDSTITDDGTNVTTSVDLIIQGGAATIGTALQDGALTLYGNGFAANLSTASLTGTRNYTLPDGSGEICILQLGNCASGAPNNAQYLTLALDAGLTAERTLSFNGTNFNVSDGGANGAYSVNTAQNINTSAAPSFAGLTLTGNLNLNSNTIQGTNVVVDFTNFDVAANGNVLAGTYNGQTISSVSSLTGTLAVAGLTTLNGGLTVETGDTLTFNGEAFTDLTGNGLQVVSNALTLLIQANKGLEVDGNGLSLIDCTTGQILKYNGSNQWACDADAGGSGVGDDILVNSANADGANFVDTAATGSVASVTWTLNNIASPDEISLTVGVASATEAGVITTGTQTFAGDKTFTGLVTLNGGLTVQTGDSVTINSDTITDLTGTGLQVVGSALETTLGTSVDLTSEVNGTLPITNGGTGATDATNARSNLGAAASGANSDITSLSGLTTALSIAQGGTEATTAQGAIDNLSGLTTNGDLLFHNGINTVRLARGSNGECLLSSGTSINWGSCAGTGTTFFTLQATSGTPQAVNGGDTVTIAAGNNITTTAGATDTITVATVNNPVFTTSVTTPLLQSTGALTFDSGSNILFIDGSDTTIRRTAAGDFVFDLVDSANTTFVIDNSGAGAANLQVSGLTNCDSIDTDAFGNLVCGTDAGGSGLGDNILVNGSNASDGNFVDTAVTSSVAGLTWNLNTMANPDEISLTVSVASASDAGIVTATTQTFGGDKTFNGLVTLNGNLVVQTGDSVTINGDTITDLTGTGLQVIGSSLETTLGTTVDLTSEVTGQLPDANVSDTITVGAAGSVNDAALSSNVTKLGATITKDELTGTGLLGFTWSDSEVADNLTIDWTGLQNYPTGCNSGEAVTAVGDTLTCAVFATADTDTTYSAGNDLDLSGTTFNIESQLDFVSTINRTGANLTLQTTTSGDIILSSAGSIRLSGFDCTGYTNGGVLTTDASGNIVCANDEGAAGGTITGSGTSGKLSVFTGTNTIGDAWLTQNVSTLEVDNGHGLSILGGNLNVTGSGTFSSTIAASNFSGSSSGTNTGDVSLSGQNYLSLSGQVITADQIDLTTHVTGILPAANGGTGNGFTEFTGASGSTKTYTLPNASTTILTTNDTVTIGQGGTGGTTAQDAINNLSGLTTEGDLLYHNGVNTTRLARGSNGQCLLASGTTITWGSCSGSGTTFFTIQGSTGTPQSINGGDTVTIAAGNNITTTASATDTITVATVNNPTFSTSITTPIIQSAGSLTLDAGSDILLIDASDTTIRRTAAGDFVFDLNDASDTTFVVDNSGAGAANLRVSGLANCDSIDTDASGNLVCGTDAGGSGVGDSIQVNGSNASDGNFVDTTASGTTAGLTWNLNTGPNPDQISLTVSNASATVAGVVTTAGQTFAGDKTFSGLVTLNGDLVVETGDSITINGDTLTDLVGTGLQVVGSTLETTLGTTIDLTSEVTGQLPDANVSDTITVGASGSVNDAALSSNVTKLGATITKDELTGSGLLGFTWSDSEVADNLTIDWTGLQNYPTGCNIGEAVTAVGDTLTCAVFATADTDTTYSAGNDLDLSGTTFNIESQLDFVSTINRTGSNLTLQTTTSGDIILSSAGNITLSGFNCTTYTNGGVLTTDASGNIICANDEGAAGGSITGSGTSGKLSVFTGTNTIGDAWLTQNVSTLEIDNGRNLELLGGDLTVDGDGTFTGTIAASNFSGNSSGTNTGDVSLSGQNYLSLSGQVITANQINLGTHVTGTLPITNGGTGATDATNARSNLGAAASGANSDITSLSGLTTALSVGQGGTGATTFTTNGILFGNGTSAIQVTAAAADSVLITNGSNVPTLSQTLPAAVQANITTVGVVTSGTWNGTVISDTYVSDTLTVGSAGTVDWTALNNYPAACAAGEAITQLGDTITCAAFASSSGSGNYIQNQNASQQTSANFWISGTGRADTALQAPIFDTATATTLTIGGTATAVSVVDDVTLAAGKYLRITGDNTAGRPASPSEGTLFYDTTTKQLLVYANGKWKADSTDAILVAASNSSQADKDAADFVADGTSDQIEINAALTAGAGRKVVLFAGTYIADGTILVPNNTTLVGSGMSTTTIQLDVGSGSDNLIENSDTSTGENITIRDIDLDGSLGTGGTQYGLYFDGLWGGKLENLSSSGWDYGAAGMLTNSTSINSFENNLIWGDIYLESDSGINNLRNNVVGLISVDNSSINQISDTDVGSLLIDNYGGIGQVNDSDITEISLANDTYILRLSDNDITKITVTDSSIQQIVGNTIRGGDGANPTLLTIINGSNMAILSNVFENADNYAISIDSSSTNIYLADNILNGLPIDNQSSSSVFNGQVDDSGNFLIQPAGTIELMKDTNITGNLTVSGTSQFSGLATFDNNLRISDGSGNYATIDVQSLAGDYTVSIPTITANDTFCLVSLANCAASPGNFIQNQNASQQTSADFWISGTGRADTALQAPAFDTATAGTLTIGGTATDISIADDTTIASGKYLRITGDNTAGRPATPSAGTLFYDTTTNQLLTYNGSKWVSDRAATTKIVAASNASQALKDAADYIATGTNDETTINTALTAASGGKVYLTEGTFTLGDSISVPNNTTLSGAGNGTLLTIANSFNTSINAITNTTTGGNGEGIIIQDLRLDGNSTNQVGGTMRGIYLDGVGSGTGFSSVHGATVNQVRLFNWNSYGIYMTSSSHNTVTNSVVQGTSGIYITSGFENNIADNSITGGSTGVSISSSSDNSVSNNLIQNNLSNGIFLNGSSDNSLVGNSIRDNGSSGIFLLSGSNNTVISGNVVQNSIGNGMFINGSSNNAISGNIARDNTQSGFYFSSSSYNTVAGNIADDNDNFGFQLGSGSYNTFSSNDAYSNTSAAFFISSDSNTITGNTSNSDNYGFQVGGNSNTITGNTVVASTIMGVSLNGAHNTISSNTIESATVYGINVGSNSNTISNNRIINSGDSTDNNAIHLVSADSNTITGNNITDSSASSTNYAINISDSGSDDNYLSDNTLGSGSINNAGTGTIFGGQLNSSGNYVIDPAGTVELQSNTNITGTLSVSGLATFDNNLRISDGSGNYATISVQSLAGDYTVSVPTITGNDTFCLVNLANCAASPGSFIQNQNAGQQTSADFWISGTGRADTSVLSPLFDTATATTLTIGGTATAISLADDTTLVSGKYLRITGDNTAGRPATPSAGTLFYDTTTNQLLVYNGTKWVSDRSTTTKIVAASNASQTLKDSADYVATGTNDHTTINSALTAASGGKVYLTEGTFTLGGSISIPNNTTLSGAGNGTLITIANSYNTSINAVINSDTSTGTGIAIQNFKIDGNKSNQSSGTMHAIYLNNMGNGSGASARTGAKINNIIVSNWRNNAVYLLGTTANTTISNITSQANDNGISLSGSLNTTVTGNLIEGNASHGISVSGDNNTITGNTSQGNTSNGIYITGDNNTVTGNTTQGNDYGIVVQNSSGNVISGNTAEGNTSYGIQVSSSSSNNSSVTGNVIANNGSGGLSLAAGTANNIINGNRFYDNGGATTNNGIVGSNADNNTITGNLFTDSAASSTNYAISLNSLSDSNYLADNTLGAGSINNAGTNTIFGGQLNSSGNYVIDPSGTIDLQSNTSITGTLGVSALTTLSGGLTVTNGGNVAFQRNATDYTATGTQDNVNFGTGVMFRITSASPVTINGIAGGTDGRLMTLVNASASTVTIGNNASGTPANNVTTGTGSNAALLAGASVNLAYDSSSNVWRIIGSGSGVGGGTYVDLQGSTPGTPQTGNLNIDGTGIFGTAIKGPSLDAASAGSLSLGTTTATSILMGSNATTTISVGQSTTTNTINIGNANLTSGTQTINIGTGPSSSGISTVAIGSTNSSSGTTINGGTSGVLIATNGGTGGSAGTVVRSATNNSAVAFQVQNASSAAAFSVNTSTPNLIQNPSFEGNNYNGWSLRGGPTNVSIERGSPQTNFGNYGMQLNTMSNANNGIQYNVGLQPSTQYTFSFFVRRDTGSANAFNIGVAENGTDNNCLTNQTFNTTWTQFSCTFTTGSTIGATPNVYIKQTDTTADSLYIDGVTLVAGATARTYTNSMEANTLQVENATSGVKINLNNNIELQEWRTSANILPANRADPATATSNGYIYVMGGGTASDGGTPQNTVYYTKVNVDGSIGSWNTTSTLGTAVSGAQATVVNGYMYLIGGSTNGGGSGHTGGQSLVQYARINVDGTLGTWTTTTALPQARYEPAVTSANGYIYVLSGKNTSNAYQTTIYYAKVNSDGTISSWNTNATALSFAQARTQAVVLNGKLYIVGGESAASNQVLEQQVFTINKDGTLTNRLISPTDTSRIPTIVGDTAVATLNGGLYVIGGWNGTTNTRTVYYSAVRPDGTTSSWGTTTSLPTALENTPAVTVNGYVYMIGGEGNSGLSRGVYYTSAARTQIGGSLDLVGLGGQTLADGSSAGTLTAGNTTIVGTFQVQEAATFNNNMTVNGTLAVNATATFRNDANSATAFQIQNAAGTAALTVDTTTLNVVIGNGGNTVTMSANGITLAGTARNSKKILLSAEYLSSVLDPGTASDNTGSMTSGYDTTNRMNYYKWTTASGTTQSYDVVVQVPLPNDFSAWASNTPLTISTYSSTTSANTIQVQLLDSGNSAPTGYNFTDITPNATTTWQSKTPATTITGTYTPGDYITLRIRMYSPTGGDIRIGNVILNYLSNK